MSECPKCGASYGADDDFCPECGVSVKGEGQKNVIIIIFLSIFVFLICLTPFSFETDFFSKIFYLLPSLFMVANIILFLVKVNKFYRFNDEKEKRIFLSVLMGYVTIFTSYLLIARNSVDIHPFGGALLMFFGAILLPVFCFILSLIVYYLLKFKEIEIMLINIFMFLAVISFFVGIIFVYGTFAHTGFEIATNKNNSGYCTGNILNVAYSHMFDPTSLEWEDECYYQFAIKENNPSLCRKIRNQNNKNTCLIKMGEKGHGLPICDEIEIQERKAWCYSTVAKEKQDDSICDKIPDIEHDTKDMCYYGVARAKQDISTCDKMKSQEPKEWCYMSIMTSNCREIQNQNEKHDCYDKIFETLNDVSLCDNIASKDDEQKSRCYCYITKSKNNPSFCEEIKVGSYNEESCYMDIARAKQDSSICDKIKTESSKGLCYREVSSVKKGIPSAYTYGKGWCGRSAANTLETSK